MRSIAVVNWKGGSGKSTTAMALAIGLAQRLPKRERVLLIDNDPQANATMIMLGGETPAMPTLTDVLLEDASAVDAIRQTRVGGLDILPADSRLADLTMLLAEEELGRERRLRMALRSIEKSYAVCVVDSPPQLSLLTVNVLQAVTEVLVPIASDVFGVAGLGRLRDTVERVRHYLEHPELAIVGLLVTKFNGSRAAKELLKQLREEYSSLVYKSVIPAAACVEDSHLSYRSVVEAFPQSEVAKKYAELVSEVLKHGQSKRDSRSDRPQSRPSARKRRAAG
jgi:chromosome partitioning protein